MAIKFTVSADKWVAPQGAARPSAGQSRTYTKPKDGPVTRPIIRDPDHEERMKQALTDVRVAYEWYQFALKRLSNLGQVKVDPTAQSQRGQLRFPFADRYITEH